MMNMTEDTCTQCYSNNVSEANSLHAQHDNDEAVISSASDRMTVLATSNLTNITVQVGHSFLN